MNKTYRVLIVEDSEDDTLLLVRQLKQSGLEFSHQRVASKVGMSEALKRSEWDLVLSDHLVPGFGSLEALSLLKEKNLDVPFIIVSGAIGEETAVNAMKAGAHDFIMKGKTARLMPTIERELREADGRRERRSAEQALDRSLRELDDFFEHAPMGLHLEGPDGTILRVNAAALEMLGYSKEEYLGHNSAEFHVEPGVAEEYLRRLQTGATLTNYEVRLRCKDDSVRHVLINANVLWEDGKFVHSRCFLRDITDRRQAEATRAYLAALVESSEDGIIGKTLDGTITTWNKGAEQIYGYTEDEVKGRSVSMLIPSHRPEDWSPLFERIRCGKHVERYETVRQRKDGKMVEISLALSPIRDRMGKVVGVSAIERDITERKREEAERLRLINELTEALAGIKTLRGLLPICSSCKKIRDDRGYWQKVESYISAHSEAEFTHGICPDCLRQLYPEYQPRS